MKTLFFVVFLSISFIVNGQSGMYIVTEKYDITVSTIPTFDSVYVTNPSGITVSYKIPILVVNTPGHDSQLNIIFNGINSQGYKLVNQMITSHNNTSLQSQMVEYHIFWFGVP